MSSIIAAVIGALGSVFSVLVGVWMKDRKNRRTSSQRELILETLDVTPVLNELLFESGAARCLLLRAVNGGDDISKAIREGKPIHGSIILEVHDAENPPLTRMWQNRLLDDPYKEMLLEAVQNGRARRVTHSMPEGSSLRAILASHDIVKVNVLNVFDGSNADGGSSCIYLGIHYKDDLDLDAEHRLAATQHAASVLQTRFRHVWKTL